MNTEQKVAHDIAQFGYSHIDNLEGDGAPRGAALAKEQ